MIVEYRDDVTLVDREALAMLSKRSVFTIRDRCRVVERQGQRPLYNLNESLALLAVIPSRGARTSPNDRRSIVYYLRIDGYVKIGRTVDLDQRLKAYPPTAVILALEWGGADVERHRLEQFEHLRIARREWHVEGDDLSEHIDALSRDPDAPRIALDLTKAVT